jgi:glutamyl-tRNA reductase
LQPYLAVFTGPEALLHLVRVAAGLDSLVVGEDQIRGPLRDAPRPSVASAGVHVAQRAIAEGPANKPVAVLGAGVMARVAAESIVAEGARVRLLNRTPGHADALAAQLGGEVSIGGLDDLPRALEEAVLIVGATASRVPIVEMDRLARATFPHARPRRLRRTEAMRPTRLAGREAGGAGSADVNRSSLRRLDHHLLRQRRRALET